VGKGGLSREITFGFGVFWCERSGREGVRMMRSCVSGMDDPVGWKLSRCSWPLIRRRQIPYINYASLSLHACMHACMQAWMGCGGSVWILPCVDLGWG